MRIPSWRLLTFAAVVVAGTTWMLGAGWQVSRPWPVRDALAKLELSREEVACNHRFGADNQQRCRDLARIMSQADHARAYFEDGLVVFGPLLPLAGFAWWLLRGSRGGHPPRIGRPGSGYPHRHRPSAA
ncbi:MAG: hypothetical protein FJX54_19700 [Alphaproteobacteria bacterium]|nr:hypothetical protein [Alphaproteobacteria bacterium]